MIENVHIVTGSDRYFNRQLTRLVSPDQKTSTLTEAVQIHSARIRASQFTAKDFDWDATEHTDNVVVHADDFGHLLSHAVDDFMGTMEGSYESIGTLIVQNPPKRVLSSIKRHPIAGKITHHTQPYRRVHSNRLPAIYEELSRGIAGQEACKRRLIEELYRLSVMTNQRPSVLLFYGPSGVGKTETAKAVARATGGNLTRIQFSMMQTIEAQEYLFGAEHSKASFARDLLGRDSNVVLIDEFDKVSPALYNLFYDLFDEGRFEDTNYSVQMKNGLFILTSNFQSEEEIRNALGPAMFSRISACIRFEELTDNEKLRVAQDTYENVLQKLSDPERERVQAARLDAWFTANIGAFHNMRSLKGRIEEAIFATLCEPIWARDEEGSVCPAQE